MAKTTKEVVTETQGKSVEELKEVAKTLQAQLNQYREMAIKAQGALEVILQLIPEAEVEKMIVKEGKDNNKSNGEVVEG